MAKQRNPWSWKPPAAAAAKEEAPDVKEEEVAEAGAGTDAEDEAPKPAKKAGKKK